MTQDLNKDCLIEGDKFTVSAMILVLDENDNVYECDVSAVWGVEADGSMDNTCPSIILRIASGAVITEINIGSIPELSNSQDWDSLYGQFDVTPSIANVDLVSIQFTKLKKELNIVVDNLSITRVESEASRLVSNGDFRVGDARYYKAYSGGSIHVGAPGYDDNLSMH